ncbi:GntR family transcriptional regulator [Clostridium merdae]|uniref:GntR family transcriptional regulator n=1 Tax=Clostridium merdae TaxID=1958780 RepID=UPI000A26A587|nr:GntR family transcriptional regulator [Clostridium merdae]
MVNDSLKEKAYRLIKEKIINCEYMPSSFLVENELMEQVGASRTPIREALNKLEQENLVRILPKKGVVVCDIVLGDINKIFEVRELVEPYIIRNYAANISREVLLAVKKKITVIEMAGERTTVYAADNDLHQMLISASNNAYFSELMSRIYAQNHRIRILSGQKIEHRIQETHEEHMLIFSYLLDEKYEEAAEAMKEHLQRSKLAAINAMMS